MQLHGSILRFAPDPLRQLWFPGPVPPGLQPAWFEDRCVTAVANRTILLRSAE